MLAEANMEVATLEAPMWHNQSMLFVRAAALFSESVKPLQSSVKLLYSFTSYAVTFVPTKEAL